MVRHMTGGQIRERPHRERIVAGNAPPLPSLCWQVRQESNRGATHGIKLRDVIRPGAIVRARRPNGHVLIEARKRSREAAREPEGTRHKQPFGVIEVADHLTDAPLVWGIAME